MKKVKVQVRGQYYWQDGKVKQISAYGYEDKVFVEVPVNQLHKCLSYIQFHVINDVLKKRNPKATRFRTCEIVGNIPQAQFQPAPQDVDEAEGIDISDDFPTGPQVVPEPTITESEFPTDAAQVEEESVADQPSVVDNKPSVKKAGK